MSNLKRCSGPCQRNLPKSLFPRSGEVCWWCTFGMKPTDAVDVMKHNGFKEEVYVKHETDVINYIKKSENGLSIKELNQLLDVSKDALYHLCTELVKHGKLDLVKEQRGPGKAQNIYTIPAVQGYMEDMEDEPKVTATWDGKLNGQPIMDLFQPPQPSWDELKNRLIKDGDCGTALKIMVDMEEEAQL